MPSPFPGMDPYLEDPAVWEDFHGEFIYACRHLLLDVLPPEYDAPVGKLLRLIERTDDEASTHSAREAKPDIAVTQQLPVSRRSVQGGAATLDLEPVVVAVPTVEEVVDRWIEVRHREDDTLITAIEILSPTNKTSDGFGEYQAKRQSFLRQRVNLVELDLLVGGRRPERAKGQPTGDYYAFVSRADRPGHREVYAWSVRRTLPNVPIPLRSPHPDVLLELGVAFTQAYDHGRYARRLRYQEPLLAPVADADRNWAQELVARSGVSEKR